jgi:hypothetical protein
MYNYYHYNDTKLLIMILPMQLSIDHSTGGNEVVSYTYIYRRRISNLQGQGLN